MKDAIAHMGMRALFVAFIGILLSGIGAAHASEVVGTISTAPSSGGTVEQPSGSPSDTGSSGNNGSGSASGSGSGSSQSPRLSGTVAGGSPAAYPGGAYPGSGPAASVSSPEASTFTYSAYPAERTDGSASAGALPGAPEAGGPLASASSRRSVGSIGLAQAASAAEGATANTALLAAAGAVIILGSAYGLSRYYGRRA